MSGGIIDSTGHTHESRIVDSSAPGYVSSYQKKEKKKPAEDTGKDIVHKIVESEIKKKVTKAEEQEAANLIKNLVSRKMSPLRRDDFKFTNMVFFKYDAKDKKFVYDKTPLILSLRSSQSYVLGLNLHWCPVPLRRIFIQVLFRMYQKEINEGKPLRINYKQVKPLILRLGLQPIIKLYIKGRMSPRGIVVPHHLWLTASNLRAEAFSNGKSAEQMYKMALNGRVRA